MIRIYYIIRISFSSLAKFKNEVPVERSHQSMIPQVSDTMRFFNRRVFSFTVAVTLLLSPSHSASVRDKFSLSYSDQIVIPDRPNHLQHYSMPLLHSSTWTKSGKRKPATLSSRQSSVAIGKCDGKANFIQDLTIVSLVTGVVGTIISVFSVSYTSMLGNFISVISSALSFGLGIPAALITYSASTDLLSYIAGNFLTVIQFWNSVYGSLSVAFGTKDIFTSHLANIIGIFSIVISIITAFPALFDETIELVGRFTGNRKQVHKFVRQYGCYGDPTIYAHVNSFINQKLADV